MTLDELETEPKKDSNNQVSTKLVRYFPAKDRPTVAVFLMEDERTGLTRYMTFNEFGHIIPVDGEW